MKARHYIITGVFAYILFLITSTPATTIYMFSDRFPQVKIQGVSGTLWNGSAQHISIISKHTLTGTNWSFCAWRLLFGEFCLDLDAHYQGNPVYAEIGAGLGGSLLVRNLATNTDAQLLGQLAGLPLGELAGKVSVEADYISLKKGSAPRAEGVIIWSNASIIVAETAKLGTVSIVLSESDDFPLAATISNKGGDITLHGDVNIIDDGTYKLVLNLTPSNQASKNVRTSLEMFAKKQTNGSFLLKNSGNIEQLGLM